MTEPGVFVWTSPHGHHYLRDHTGSQPLNRAHPDHPAEPTGHPPDH